VTSLIDTSHKPSSHALQACVPGESLTLTSPTVDRPWQCASEVDLFVRFKLIIALEKFETGVTIHVAFDTVRVCWLAVSNDDRLQGGTIPFTFNAGGGTPPSSSDILIGCNYRRGVLLLLL